MYVVLFIQIFFYDLRLSILKDYANRSLNLNGRGYPVSMDLNQHCVKF